MCITVYHNNRWSKSRNVIQLLRDNNIDFTIIEYLKKPLSAKTLTKICKLLAIEPGPIIPQRILFISLLMVKVHQNYI